ncbi:MAG TPA: hypothetical protein VLV50_01385 [Stellaceae bacterium]|nr:hypothetical protein [Stellaceae bacterium]
MQYLNESDPIAELDRAAEGLADSVVAGLSPAVAEALADPIVRAMMAADRVERTELEDMLRRASQNVIAYSPAPSECQRQHFCGAHGA